VFRVAEREHSPLKSEPIGEDYGTWSLRIPPGFAAGMLCIASPVTSLLRVADPVELPGRAAWFWTS
jgi:hypothetical protein